MVRKLKFFTIFSLLFLLGLVLVSCGGQSGEPTTTTSGGNEDHTHVYGEWVTDGENHWHQCSCGDKKDLAAHSLDVTQQDATCDNAGSITYSCGVCGYTNTVTTAKLDHKISTISYKDEEVADQTCKHEHVTVGTCAHCGKEIVIDKSTYETHTYKSSIQTPATCSRKGTYLYKCVKCGDEYTVEYTDKDAHTWGTPTVDGNKKTYKCSGCNETKVVIDAKQEVAAKVSKDDLTTVGAVELKNATIELDNNALQGFENATNINISADTVDKETLSLNDQYKERIGENEVFDFQMTADGNQVSQFSGYITVTIPYTLKANDDPNAIVIWYLGDSGEPEAISAKYSNGFVSFETNHFSYYVVVQMTPEEACKLFDHEYVTISEKDSTCETLGVKVEKCKRCNHVETTEIELKKHNWVEVRTQEPTISAPGLSVYECSLCHQTKLIQLPKLSNKDASILAKIFDGILNQMKAEGIKVEQTRDGESFVGQVKINGNAYYTISKEENGDYNLSLVDVSAGKSVSYDYDAEDDEYRYSTSTMPASALASMDLVFNNKVFKMTDLLTQYVDSKLIDDFINKLIVIAFDITTENGTITYTFNADKLSKMYGDSLDLTVGGLLDLVIGAGTTDKIIASLTAAGNKTVQQVIDDISKQGIDVEGIINFALGYMDYYQSNYDIEMPFDTTMIKAKMPEIKKMKVNEVLAMIPNNKMTLTDIIGMVNQYKNAKVSDLISMMFKSSSSNNGKTDSKPVQQAISSEDTAIISGESTEGNNGNTANEPQIPSADDIKTLLKDYVIRVTLNQDYQLQSAYFKNASTEVTISKGENVVAEYEKAESAMKAVVDPMLINGDTKLYDKAFNQTFGTNLTFEYAINKNGSLIAKTSTFNEDTLQKFTEYMYKYGYYDKPLANKGTPTGYYLEFDFGNQRYVYVDEYESLNYLCRQVNGNDVAVYAMIDGSPVYIGSVDIWDLGSYIIVDKTNNKYYLGRSFSLNQYLYEVVSKDNIPADAKIYESSTEIDSLLRNIEGIEKETIYLKGTNIFNGENTYRSFVAYKKDGKYIYTPLNLYNEINLYPLSLERANSIYIYYYFDGNLYYRLSDSWRDYSQEGYQYVSWTATNGKASFTYKGTENEKVKYELKVLNTTYNLSFDVNKSYWRNDSSTLVASFNIDKCTVLNLYTAYNNPNVLVVETATSHKEATRVLLPATITQNGLIQRYCTECGDTMGRDSTTPTGTFNDNVEVLFEDFSDDNNPYLFGWYTGQTYDDYSLWKYYSVVLAVVEDTIGKDGEVVTTIVTDAPSVKAYEANYYRTNGTDEVFSGRFLAFDAKEVESLFAYTLAENQHIAIAATNNYSARVTVYVLE